MLANIVYYCAFCHAQAIEVYGASKMLQHMPISQSHCCTGCCQHSHTLAKHVCCCKQLQQTAHCTTCIGTLPLMCRTAAITMEEPSRGLSIPCCLCSMPCQHSYQHPSLHAHACSRVCCCGRQAPHPQRDNLAPTPHMPTRRLFSSTHPPALLRFSPSLMSSATFLRSPWLSLSRLSYLQDMRDS